MPNLDPALASDMTKLDLAGMAAYRGGRLALSVDELIANLVADMRNRPKVAKPRSLTLTFTFKPIADEETGELEDVRWKCEHKHTVPARSTAEYTARASGRDGGLYGREDSPDAPGQMSIGDVIEGGPGSDDAEQAGTGTEG